MVEKLNKINIIFWMLVVMLLPIYILFSNSLVNNILLDGQVYHETYAFHTYQSHTISFLNENEISHMKDVRQLLSYGFVLLLFIINYFIYQKFNLKELKIAGSIVLILFTVFIVWSLIDFNGLFNQFHELFFTDNWMFDVNSNMKIAYPNYYFSTFFTLHYILILIANAIFYKLE